MNQQDYENKYSKTVRKLRIIGWICLSIGIGAVATGTGDFFMSAGSWEEPKLFFLCFIGVPIAFVGIACLMFGYQRKVSDFAASQSAPVVKDFTNYMIDGTSDAVTNVAGKVANAVKTNNNGVEGVTQNTCSKCGTPNPVGAKFCSKCGNPLTKKCPYCGTENDDGAQYCNNCGKKLY